MNLCPGLGQRLNATKSDHFDRYMCLLSYGLRLAYLAAGVRDFF
jgi:hypothetical protein